MCSADPDRLLAHVYRCRLRVTQGGGGKYSSLNAFRDCLADLGFDHYWINGCADSDWSSRVHVTSRLVVLEEEAAKMAHSSSLQLFRRLRHDFSSGTHAYLHDRQNRLGTRLKSSLRFGTLWLLSRVASVLKWPRSGGACLLCRSGIIEDAQHFLLDCPALSVHRDQFLTSLQSALASVGGAGVSVWSKFQEAVQTRDDAALELIAGACPPLDRPRGYEQIAFEEECGKAYYVFDKCVKNYLVRCWRARGARIGTVRVAGGILSHIPAAGTFSFRPPMVLEPLTVADRSLWEPFVRLYRIADKPIVSRKCKKRKNFFVVTRGRVKGIFERWCDAFASVAGFSGAKVKGFNSLADARKAWGHAGEAQASNAHSKR